MDKNIEFLLRYAKLGVLSEMDKSDKITAEELKDKYLAVKKSFEDDAPKKQMPKKMNAEGKTKVGKWLQGVGDRRRTYLEEHKGL